MGKKLKIKSCVGLDFRQLKTPEPFDGAPGALFPDEGHGGGLLLHQVAEDVQHADQHVLVLNLVLQPLLQKRQDHLEMR